MSECSGTRQRLWGLLGGESISVAACDFSGTGECALARAIIDYYYGIPDDVLITRREAVEGWKSMREKGVLALRTGACKAPDQIREALRNRETLPDNWLEALE
ncbi:MAG: hypothetical protein HYS86_03440 [Candidatus Chisholmbacteria bacterium]|nr:hypothetical protein [Candidatus Chisholmbacteria bacterium]